MKKIGTGSIDEGVDPIMLNDPVTSSSSLALGSVLRCMAYDIEAARLAEEC